MESGTGDGSHEWLDGFRDAYRNSSSDPSTGPDNGIPVVPRVDGWDGEGPAVESRNMCKSRRRDDTYVLCGSAWTGATRGNSEASRQTHWSGARMHVNVAEWRSVVSLGERLW